MYTIIWDFNGTIVDDTQLCLDIENYMLEERGMKHGYTLEEYRNMFCFPVRAYYEKLGYDFSIESYEDLSVEFNHLYDESFPTLKLVPGCLELLQESKKRGFQNVIISATRHTTLVKELKILGIFEYFDTLVGIDDDLAGSKIESAKAWAHKHNINPIQCLFIGDSLHDLETASAIGVENCVLVACGHQSYEALSKGNTKVAHTLSEIDISGL